MNVLSQKEFEYLTGTEIMINMLRNRVLWHATLQEMVTLSEYLEHNTTGFYYLKSENTNTDLYRIVAYFENPADAHQMDVNFVLK